MKLPFIWPPDSYVIAVGFGIAIAFCAILIPVFI